jgi:hypothetical protein
MRDATRQATTAAQDAAIPRSAGEVVPLFAARGDVAEQLLRRVLGLALANADRPQVLAAMVEAGKAALG